MEATVEVTVFTAMIIVTYGLGKAYEMEEEVDGIIKMLKIITTN